MRSQIYCLFDNGHKLNPRDVSAIKLIHVQYLLRDSTSFQFYVFTIVYFTRR